MSTNGKGDRDRTKNREKYRNQFDRIFRKKIKSADVTPKQFWPNLKPFKKA